MQPKLLRFLETHEIHPLGEPHPVKVDVRVIAATNASVEQLMADGRFRGDLFYRLNVMRLSLPPLRERREEIPPLVQHYVRKYPMNSARDTSRSPTTRWNTCCCSRGLATCASSPTRSSGWSPSPSRTAPTPALLSPEIQASRRTIAATPAAEVEVRVALDQPLPAAVDMLEQVMVRRALDRTHGRRGSLAAARHLPQGPVPQAAPLGTRGDGILTPGGATARRRRTTAAACRAWCGVRARPRGSSAAN